MQWTYTQEEALPAIQGMIYKLILNWNSNSILTERNYDFQYRNTYENVLTENNKGVR